MLIEHTREERAARLAPALLHTFDLPAILRGLREEAVYEMNGRHGTTLVKNPDLRVVLEVVRQGSGLAEHEAPGPITFQVLEGEVRFEAGDEVVYLNEGELLTLPGGVRHAVEGVRDSAFLLTIAPEGQMPPR